MAQAVAQSNALLPSGELMSDAFDANVYTNAVAQKVEAIGEALVAERRGRPVLISDVARVEIDGNPRQIVERSESGTSTLKAPSGFEADGALSLELYDAMRELFRATHPGLHIPAATHKAFRPGDIRHSQADVSKARRVLGYQPTHDVKAGLSEALPWYEAHFAQASFQRARSVNDVRGAA